MHWFLLVLVACRSAGGLAPPPSAACSSARVGEVHVTGATRDQVAALVVLEGTLDNPPRTERIAAEVANLLRAEGYARVRIAATRREGCGVRLDVAVTLGPRYRIARIHVVGGGKFPDATRRVWLAQRFRELNIIGGIYRGDHLEHTLVTLRGLYVARGWLLAKLGPAEARYDHARAEVTVRIPIEAGRRFTIGELHASPDATSAAALAALGMRSGDWYDAPRQLTGLDRAGRRIGRRVSLVPRWIQYDKGMVHLDVEVAP